jgi:multiple sugar transport system ATP-binding protein
MVAGLEHPTAGEILIGERVVNDLDPVDRDTAMVFQNYALYPHMTVRDNIGFPLRMQNVAKAERSKRVEDAAGLLGIGELLERKPGALSGGQRQRVAMGRAIIRHPTTFLMDEPLSNLDAKLRVQMRAELVKLHQRLGVTTLYVTHDQTEAMTLGERVAVLNHGVVQQVDTPDVLYNRPANTFVATFIGSPAMNFLKARLSGGALEFSTYRLELPAGTRARLGAETRDVLLGLRPEHFFDTRLGSDANACTLPVTVELTEQLGSETLLYFRADGIDAEQTSEGEVELGGALVARLDPRTQASPGERLVLGIDAERAHVFDASTGLSV